MQNENVQKCLAAFVEKMNKKAEEIGLTNTEYNTPCGGGESTAADIVKCLIKGNTYKELQKVWGTNRHSLPIDGEEPRELTVVSTIFEEEEFRHLKEKYNILGGKTGTLTRYGAFNLSFIADVPGSDDKFACAILYANETNSLPNNRFKAARQALDAAMKKYLDPSADVSATEVCAQSASVCLLPKGDNPAKILFEKNADERKRPASMIKITTAMVTLDTISDLDTPVPVTEEVIECIAPGFRGDDFKAGDIVRLQDLLYAMMLPSSNIAAFTIGAFVGSKILESK